MYSAKSAVIGLQSLTVVEIHVVDLYLSVLRADLSCEPDESSARLLVHELNENAVCRNPECEDGFVTAKRLTALC